MKKVFLISFSLITVISYSQMNVIPAPNGDGISTQLINANNYSWQIWNDASNWWGHTNNLDFVDGSN